MPGAIIEDSHHLVGYEVEWFEKEDFEVVGYTALHRPETPDFELWESLRGDGRLDRLIEASDQPRLFGCSSAAKAAAGMPEGTYRHTVCFEGTPGARYDRLNEEDLFRMNFQASRWVSFNMPKERFFDGARYLFWEADPYGMVKRLGYQFNSRIAVHMDVFDLPDTGIFHLENPADRARIMHFWMPVR